MITNDIDAHFLNLLLTATPEEAWKVILDRAWAVMSSELPGSSHDLEVSQRDRVIGKIDAALLSSWELWSEFPNVVPKGSQAVKKFWANDNTGKALLILDALSLREVPWILKGAKDRGYKIDTCGPVASELPAETTEFAKALGFSQRSSLAESETGNSHVVAKAKTFSCDLPWKDCENLIGPNRDIVFWHHWPDSRMHDLAEPGDGFQTLVREAKFRLESDEFWSFIEKLTTGRKLFITSDHGYAASGLFHDVTNKEQSNYLKDTYKSGRSRKDGLVANNWAPPLEIKISNSSGTRTYVLGRKKWKSSGGYPTLLHGGLTLLEVLVPMIVLGR